MNGVGILGAKMSHLTIQMVTDIEKKGRERRTGEEKCGEKV